MAEEEKILNENEITFVEQYSDELKFTIATLDYKLNQAYMMAKITKNKQYLHDLFEKVKPLLENFSEKTQKVYDDNRLYIKGDHKYVSKESKLKFVYELSKFEAVKVFLESYDEKIKAIDDIDVNDM